MEIRMLNEKEIRSESFYNDFLEGNINSKDEYFDGSVITIEEAPDFPIYIAKGSEDEKKVLFNIQRDLFYIGSELATKNTEKLNKVVTDNDIKNLENIIDKYMGEAKGIDSFIIPGTSLASAHLHIARTICRRAERIIISLSKIEEVNPMLIKYINRLSDALYAIARYSEDKLIPMEF